MKESKGINWFNVIVTIIVFVVVFSSSKGVPGWFVVLFFIGSLYALGVLGED